MGNSNLAKTNQKEQSLTFHYANYNIFLAGSFVTRTGDWFDRVAVNWYVLTLTDSPFYIGLILGDKVNQQVSVVRFMAGKTRIYYTDSFSGIIFDQLGFKHPKQQAELFTPNNKLGNLAIDVGKEAIPKMEGDILFYFTYAPKGDKAALDTAKEWTNDPLWKNLNAVKSGNAHEVSDAIWNTSGGVISANLMLDDLEKIMLKK